MIKNKKFNSSKKTISEYIHIDFILLISIISLMSFSLIIMYSASGKDLAMMDRQAFRMGLSIILMIVAAQIPPRTYQAVAPYLFIIGVFLLLCVLFFGEISKGAQRWLNLGIIRFQPSELLKIAVPLMVAKYLGNKSLPPEAKNILISLCLIFIPTILIAKQPDLGTAILIAASGIFVVFLSGIKWKYILLAFVLLAAFIPILWFFLMHDYQRTRVITLFNPELDPLGAGYHIIQSKIAIGSGGIFGKGWLHGTQSQLQFIPERNTDFIFAVIAEEWGFTGVLLLLFLYLLIIIRGLVLAIKSQNSFGRILSGSIMLSFFVYIFVNIGMVSGILPVVGVPLPLVSYGGSSMLTIMGSFGIVMSIHSHKTMLSKS